MYKTCFLFNAGEDPFRFSDHDAEDAIQSVFPRIKGYVQTRALLGQEPPAFSGLAELWFDDSSLATAACSVSIRDLLADGAEVQSCLVGMERVVVRTAEYITTDRVKGVYPFRKHPDLELGAFQRYWWHTHGPIAALTEEALSYVQIHSLADSYEAVNPAYDGITEISWPDIEAAERAIASRQMREDQGGDATNFVDIESVALFMAKEEVIIEP